MNATLNMDFTLMLESNPTTGYVWEATFDSALLELKKKDFQPSDVGSVGSGGREVFTFLPLRTGKTEIVMVRKRPWESTSVEERVFPILIEDRINKI